VFNIIDLRFSRQIMNSISHT